MADTDTPFTPLQDATQFEVVILKLQSGDLRKKCTSRLVRT